MTVRGEIDAGARGIQEWLDEMPVWRIHVVAMAAGAVATLAFAPFYVAPAM